MFSNFWKTRQEDGKNVRCTRFAREDLSTYPEAADSRKEEEASSTHKISSIYQLVNIYVASYICTLVCAQSKCLFTLLFPISNIIIQCLASSHWPTWYTLPGISRARCCQTSDGWELWRILQCWSSHGEPWEDFIKTMITVCCVAGRAWSY